MHPKIIGHSELCKMARRCDQLTSKVVFTACPAMLYQKNGKKFPKKPPLEPHAPPILSQPKLLCARNQLSCFENISEARSGLENRVPDDFMLEVYSATIYHPSVSSPTG